MTSGPGETELSALPFWPPAAVQRLRDAWITTAEQVVAAAATTGGVTSLAEQAQVGEDEMRRLVTDTRDDVERVGESAPAGPIDTSEYGLGAMKPRQ